MSKVHDAMRHLEHQSAPETGSGAALNNLVGALIEELADEVPDDPKLETVRADLLAASRSFETGKKKDLALRFYLALRSLLREHELLQERLKRVEKRNQTEIANAPVAAQDRRDEAQVPADQTQATWTPDRSALRRWSSGGAAEGGRNGTQAIRARQRRRDYRFHQNVTDGIHGSSACCWWLTAHGSSDIHGSAITLSIKSRGRQGEDESRSRTHSSRKGRRCAALPKHL
jgi:hypothetical protein